MFWYMNVENGEKRTASMQKKKKREKDEADKEEAICSDAAKVRIINFSQTCFAVNIFWLY